MGRAGLSVLIYTLSFRECSDAQQYEISRKRGEKFNFQKFLLYFYLETSLV